MSREGRLGNYVETWDSVPKAIVAGAFVNDGTVMIRSMVPNGPNKANLEAGSALEFQYELFCKGVEFVVQPMLNDQWRTVQGELIYEPDLKMWWSTMKRPMRQALREEPRWSNGAETMSVLAHYMDASSFADVFEIMDKYPNAVVEFGCFDRGVGVLRRNTIIWEVREY